MPMTTSERTSDSKARRPESDRLFTFASGGWVVLISVLGCMVLIAWAIAPAIMRGKDGRPPGDGRTIESYNFDLSGLAVERDLVVPAMLHRHMVPTMDAPSVSGPSVDLPLDQRWTAMQRLNDPKYGKYLVPGDHVIGVTIAGESRAYPLSLLYVHEIINDVLAGTPIAVTYHWPCASAAVFDRRISGDGASASAEQRIAQFAVSGLVYNSNLLMYDRGQTRVGPDAPLHGGGNETLWSQLLGRPIAGASQESDGSLRVIPCEVVTWLDWSTRHPDTTVVNRDLRMYERYKDAAPTQYFNSQKLMFPIAAAAEHVETDPHVLAPKTRVLAIRTSEGRRVYPIPYILDHGEPIVDVPGLIEWRDSLGTRTLRFIGDPAAKTLRVEAIPSDNQFMATHSFWFAWRAMFPDDELFTPSP